MMLPLMQRLMYSFVLCRWIFNNRSRGLGFIIRNTIFDSSYFQGLYAGFLTFWCAGVCIVEFGVYRLWDVLPFRG